jgi:hypothetical protein
MNARSRWRWRHGGRQSGARSPNLDLAPAPVSVSSNLHCEHAARQRELTVRLIALVVGILGAPTLTLLGVATGHPIIALGSLGSAAPLAVAKLIRQPESGTEEKTPFR